MVKLFGKNNTVLYFVKFFVGLCFTFASAFGSLTTKV